MNLFRFYVRRIMNFFRKGYSGRKVKFLVNHAFMYLVRKDVLARIPA